VVRQSSWEGSRQGAHGAGADGNRQESREGLLVENETQPTVRPFDRTQYLDDLCTVAAKYAQLLRGDGPEVTTRAALKRLGISKLVAVPRPGSKIWDLTGRIDLEKALAEVHADDVAEPFDPDYGPADVGDVPEGGLDAAFIHSIVSPLIGSQGETAG
jgi:hypothetical protein